MGNVIDVVFFILTGLRIRRARRGEFILIIVRAIGLTSCFVYRCRGTGTCSAGTTSVSSWSDRRSGARVRHTRWRRLRGVGGTREWWWDGRSDPRRRRPASCFEVSPFCSPQTALSRSPGRRDPRTTVDLGTLGHQCVNHFALGWTLLTPSAWICIPHEARRRRRGGSHSARARAMFSTSGPHLDLTLIPMVTVRARVTLSGFDTQGTTAPNEAPCRSRQEATW